jgi:drug/metabolite transporter (DMT)-like permease
MMQARAVNYRVGGLYALSTTFLLATQEPFSFLGAERLNSLQFIWVTQVALALSIPLLILKPKSRRDFVALIRDRANWIPLAIIFALGMTGLVLYNLGLSHAHPIIIAAVLNLSPFWAAMVAFVISRVPIPVRPSVFFGCLAVAFAGAMTVAWSQMKPEAGMGGLTENLLQGSWVYAIPIPVLSALSGTLIGKWFSKYDESAAIAANFLVPAVVLIPGVSVVLSQRSELHFGQTEAIALMVFGTVVAASIGRVLYQIALSSTGNDNGFVTMFFLLVPAQTGLVSLPMSVWIPSLDFSINPTFFLGLGLIATALSAFSWTTWRQGAPQGAGALA